MDIAVIVALADMWLAAQWFRERRRPALGLESANRRVRWAGSSGRVCRCLSPPRPHGDCAALVWQHWRQSATAIAAVLAAILVPLTLIVVHWLASSDPWLEFNHDPIVYRLGVLPLLAMISWLGLCVFVGDDRKGGVGFLSERGVPPKYVWLSRQSVLLALAALTLPVFLLLAFFLAPVTFSEARLELIRHSADTCTFVFCYVVVAVAAGQFCSMFIRSPILAGIFSMLLTYLLAIWCALMLFWHVNWLWSILPIPAALLLATRLHTADWLLERKGPRTWLRPGLALLVPAVALSIAVPLDRIHQVPVLCPDFSFKEYQGTATPQEQATIEVYRRAWVKYNAAKEEKDDAAQQEAIALIVKASRQTLVHPIEGLSPLDGMLWLLLRRAEASEKAGNLDAALDQYLAAIRVTGQIRQCDWRSRVVDGRRL